MKLLVTDNESSIRSSIRQMLNIYCPEITNIEEASGVQDGLNKIKDFKPDILILDVEMDDGTGFDLLKNIQTPNFQLIFATAHNQYAIDAFRFSAIDFLLKPVDPEILQTSIKRAIENIRTKGLEQQIEILIQQLSGKNIEEKRIVLRDSETVYFLKVPDIQYCMAEGTYTKFYVKGISHITVSKNLKEYENILEPLGFIRTHHSYLVNPDKIIRFDKKDGGALILEDGQAVPVSKRRREQVIDILENRS